MIQTNILLAIVLAPLVGSIVAGLFGRRVGRAGAHTVTILGVAIAAALSMHVLWQFLAHDADPYNQNLYRWFTIGHYEAHVGFLVDKLTAMMMVVVTFVSLLVHVYTIGYMKDDPGYQRFFSYISLFTFSMLMLVMSNNFLQLFFGWEAVGLVSYLLIGFWFKKPSAIFANLKAFLVNRVGDFGFLLGIAGILYWTGTLDYATAFAMKHELANNTLSLPGVTAFGWTFFSVDGWNAATVVAICLFIGAMGKSAQVPLHVWLPDSMEGPTPISALIHAATMVTAGIFMVARMSPIFELSEVALYFILFIGATTALFTGLIGIVQNDIKRVVAYSTLSQLGYMTVALGLSAYSAAVFHLMTHAFFKALLFLAAGSVIMGMHHEQDMRRMGGLRKYMPVTWITSLIGTLALVGTPFLSGYFSKDAIIAVAGAANAAEGASWINTYAYWAVMLGVFITSFYSFRLLYLTFHGRERFRDPAPAGHDAHGHDDAHAHDDHGHGHDDHHGPHEPHESPWSVKLPLLLLAIPSIAIGALTVMPMLFGGFFTHIIEVSPDNAVALEAARQTLTQGHEGWSGVLHYGLHFVTAPAFWLAFAGFAAATVIYLVRPGLADVFARVFAWPIRVLEAKYGFDKLWIDGFAAGGVDLGRAAWKRIDAGLIDGLVVNGSASLVAGVAGLVRRLQSGYLYHYAFAMILGLIALLYALTRVVG